MSGQGNIILGISLGTRTLGLAVLKNGMLRDRRVKNFKGVWSDDKLANILNELERQIAKYQVTVIAIKAPDVARTSSNVSALETGIQKLVQKHSISLHSYSLEEIELHFIAGKHTNKTLLMNCIVDEYPELIALQMSEQQNENPYYIKLFEAIGATILCTKDVC